MDTFDDRLNLLIDFCENDQMMSVFHEQMLNHPKVDFDSWYKLIQDSRGSMAGSANLSFSTDVDSRTALMYQLLYKINIGEIALLQFTRECFASTSNKINSHIYAFNQAVTEPLFRELGYRLEDLDEELPADTMEEVNTGSIQIIHYAENVIQQNANGDNISQSATIQMDNEIASLLKDLEDEINKVATGEEQELALEAVENLEELAVEPKKNSRTIGFILKTLPTLGNIASIASAIMATIGG